MPNSVDIPLPFYVKVAAYSALFPDRTDAVIAGTISLAHPTRKDKIADDAAAECIEAFWQLVWEKVRAAS